MRSSSVDSSGGRSPLSRDSATMCSRSRGVAACSTSCTGSIRSARSSRFDGLVEQPDQPAEHRQVDRRSTGPAARATGSGRAIARFFGNSSPNTICTTVENSSASTVPTATPTPVGTPTPPSSSPRPVADQRLGDVADEQAGDRDAQLGAGEHERGAPGDPQRALRAGVTGRRAGLQPRPVHGHVGELLGHEVAGHRGDHQHHQHPEQDAQNRAHQPDTSCGAARRRRLPTSRTLIQKRAL